MVVKYIFLFMLAMYCSPELISLNFFGQKISKFDKLWNTYVDKIHTNTLNMTHKYQPNVLVALLGLYTKIFSAHNNFASQQFSNCFSQKLINISYTTSKFCDNAVWINKYPVSFQDIYKLGPHTGYDLRKCGDFLGYVQCKSVPLSFQLHQQLILNLTLIKVQIELTYNCTVEFVGAGHTKHTACEARVCGHMPVTTKFLPPISFLQIQVGIDRRPARIEVVFQVADPKFVNEKPCTNISCYHPGSLSQQIPETHIRNKTLVYHDSTFSHRSSKLSAQIFHIQSTKYKLTGVRVMIHSVPATLHIYDGPYMVEDLLLKGQVSHQLGFALTSYLGSSFQLTLKIIFASNTETVIESAAHLKLFQKDPPITQCTSSPESNPVEPTQQPESSHLNGCAGWSVCDKGMITYCILDINAAHGENSVNMTIDFLKYSGPNIDSCRYISSFLFSFSCLTQTLSPDSK